MNKFNEQAKKEAATVTTAGTTTTTGKGTTGKSTTTTSGRGFTAEEQNNFLARQLMKMGVPITEEVGGAAKVLLDEIRNVYKDNNLPEPEFESMASIVKKIIGTGDTEVSKQKLTEATQKVRNMAAKLNPGVADLLAEGENLSDIAKPYISIAERMTGKKYTANDKVIKQMLNYKDEKGNFRTATDLESLEIMRGSNDWDNSPDAYSTFSSIGDTLIAKLGLG